MQQVEQLIENNNSVAFKLSKYDRIIHTLTNRISMHQGKKTGMTNDGMLYDIYRKKIYEWRRISFALHRKRSELKSRKEVLSKNIEPSSRI